jgi:hypothetical protein
MLCIHDQTFEIIDAFFGYRLAIGERGWAAGFDLEVQARGARPAAIPVQLSTHGFLANVAAPDALRGTSIDVARLERAAGDRGPAFVLLIHGHEEVREARLAFGAFDGGRLRVELSGIVDVEDDDGNFIYEVPLRLDAPVRFDGVVVDEGWTHKAEARLAQFFDRALFDDPVKRADGAHVFKCKISP